MKPETNAQIEKWQSTCATIEGYINECPDLADMDWLLKWYSEVHTHLIYLGNEKAMAETIYKQKCALDLMGDTIPATVWQMIKNSSTRQNDFFAGTNPELYGIWQRLENLARNLETVLSDMRTLLVSLRNTESRDMKITKDQGQDERKQFKPSAPPNREEIGWPTVER